MKIEELKENKDIPVTVLGTSGLMSVFRIDLSAKGLKAIVKKMEKTDFLRITFNMEGHKIEVLK